MIDGIATMSAWFSRVFKVLLRGHAVIKEYDTAVAPMILLVRNIHDGILRGPFDANRMRGYLDRLGNSEDAAWSDGICFDCRKDFLQHANQATLVLEKHGSFRNEMECEETRLYMDNAFERLIAALRKAPLPKLFDPYEDEPPSKLARLKGLWVSKWRGRS